MSAYKSPAQYTGGVLGVKQILDNHLKSSRVSNNPVDANVILNMAQHSSERGHELRKFIYQESKNLTNELNWDKQFSPSKIDINDREILTYKKVTKVSKAMHAAFGAAVVLSEPNQEQSNKLTFSDKNREVVKEKMVTAVSEIEGLSTDRTIKASLINQMQDGILNITNDNTLAADIMNEAKQTVQNTREKALDKSRHKENNVSHDRRKENGNVSGPSMN